MTKETVLATTLLLWGLGGVVALLCIAYKEQKRLGGKLFEAMFEQVSVTPIPVIVGYTLVFVMSWVHVFFITIQKGK